MGNREDDQSIRYWPVEYFHAAPESFQALVNKFLVANDMPMLDEPGYPSGEIRALWGRLVEEEFNEFMWEIRSGELAGIAQEGVDLIWVTLGLLAAHGIDVGPVFEEVARANMSKLGPDGKPILRADGKIMKGPNFKPADVQSVLEKQKRK